MHAGGEQLVEERRVAATHAQQVTQATHVGHLRAVAQLVRAWRQPCSHAHSQSDIVFKITNGDWRHQTQRKQKH